MPTKKKTEEKAKKDKKIVEAKKPTKKKLSEKEFEKKVLELAEANMTAEKIGLELMKQGIHPSEHKTKISKILKQKGKYIQPDIKNISEKLEKIKLHAQKNKQDKRAQREVVRISAHLRKLKQYHKVE